MKLEIEQPETMSFTITANLSVDGDMVITVEKQHGTGIKKYEPSSALLVIATPDGKIVKIEKDGDTGGFTIYKPKDKPVPSTLKVG